MNNQYYLTLFNDIRREIKEYSDYLDSLKDDEYYLKNLINTGSRKHA